jgi:hypothetical protein
MEQWALVLADSVLLLVALAGAVLTLVRVRRFGGSAPVLAGAACGVLVVAAVFDMVWWTQVYPTAFEDGFSTAATLYNIGVLGTTLMISIGVGLLIVATNVGRSTAGEPVPAPQPGFPRGAPVGAQPGQSRVHQIPQQPGLYQPQQQVPESGQPASGWTPPQQPQPDWNIHSGVWSIPRGTFDGPPPDQQQPR